MANEAVIIELLGNGGDPIRYTVSNHVPIAKGTICTFVTPRTLSGSQTTGAIAGIAAAEKVTGDGSTTLAVYTNGIFDLKGAGDTFTVGDWAILSGVNMVKISSTAGQVSGNRCIGYSLETTGTESEVQAFRVRL